MYLKDFITHILKDKIDIKHRLRIKINNEDDGTICVMRINNHISTDHMYSILEERISSKYGKYKVINSKIFVENNILHANITLSYPIILF